MSIHFVRWAVFCGDATAEDHTSRDHLRSVEVDLLFIADSQPVPGPGLVAGVPLLQDKHLVQVDLSAPTPGFQPAAQTLTNRDLVTTHNGTIAGPAHNNDLTTAPSLNDSLQIGTPAMITTAPFPYVRLSGAALAVWATPPTLVHAVIQYVDSYPDAARPHYEFGGFVDDVDDLVGVEVTSAALARDLQFRTGNFTFTDQNRTITTQDACYAAPAPTGEVWLRNSQIGNNPNQIPPSAALNTVERYTFFPAVFFRQIRGFSMLTSVGPRRVAGVTESLGPLLIWQVVRAPTHSRWGLLLDGVPVDVIVAHPPGSDLRTPFEIWQGVWVSLLRAGDPTVPIYALDQTSGTNVFTVRGVLDRQTFSQKLDAARFLELYDATIAPSILSPFAQTP